MADYFDTQPNFINPAYASPEQLKAQRDYAEQLIKRSGQDVTRPAGALANMIDALTGNLTRNNAAQIQSQAAAGNAQDTSELVRQLQAQSQGGPPPNAGVIGHLFANPMASPEARSFVGGLINPKAIESPYKQPGFTSPAAPGVTAPALPPNYQPGAPYTQGAGGVSQGGVAPPPPQSGAGGVFGGMGKPVGWDQNNPATVGPNGAPNRPMSPDELVNWGTKANFQQKQGEAQTATMASDVEAANSAPTRMRLFGTMREEMLAHPEITTGPTTNFSNNVKRAIANYAPGMLGDKQIQGLAAADSIGKLSTQLASMGTAAGRSDMGLMAGMNSVPHQENSRQGFIALTEMGLAVEKQNLEMRRDLAGIKDPAQYEQARHQWFAQHPIINPLSGNPITQDLAEQKANESGGGFKVLKVH